MQIGEATLYTKRQLAMILSCYDCADAIPQRGKKTVLAFPGKEWAEAEWTNKKSEYGDRLYSLTFFEGV